MMIPPRSRSSDALRLLCTGAAVAILFNLGGCSILPTRTKPPLITDYRLTLPASATPHSGRNPICPALRVATPGAAAGFGGRDMRYSTSPHTLASYAYHRWAASPARLLEPVLVQALSQSRLFSTVITGASPGDATLQLDSQIDALIQRIHGSVSDVHLVVRASLSDLHNRRQIAAHRFVIDVPTAANPAAGARAANQAVARWTRELIVWIKNRHLCSSG